MKGIDVLDFLPTGFGKSLIYQVLPGTFDFMAGNVDKAIILVASPLNALMRDQISKLNERGLTSFMVREGRFRWKIPVEENIGRVSRCKDERNRIAEFYLFIRRSVWMIAILFHYLNRTYMKKEWNAW